MASDCVEQPSPITFDLARRALGEWDFDLTMACCTERRSYRLLTENSGFN